MHVLVTAGPAYESIDQVRRITNHSTGALGSRLCHALHAQDYEVTCLVGNGATVRPEAAIRTLEFGTNDSLLELLQKESSRHEYAAVFHAAALSDYRVARVENSLGILVLESKIPSREGELTLHLQPATKVLPHLRHLFPKALIVGWKYELDGSRNNVIDKGNRQLMEANNDAVVLNGTAWGEGFGVLQANKVLQICPDQHSLNEYLISLLLIR